MILQVVGVRGWEKAVELWMANKAREGQPQAAQNHKKLREETCEFKDFNMHWAPKAGLLFQVRSLFHLPQGFL